MTNDLEKVQAAADRISCLIDDENDDSANTTSTVQTDHDKSKNKSATQNYGIRQSSGIWEDFSDDKGARESFLVDEGVEGEENGETEEEWEVSSSSNSPFPCSQPPPPYSNISGHKSQDNPFVNVNLPTTPKDEHQKLRFWREEIY